MKGFERDQCIASMLWFRMKLCALSNLTAASFYPHLSRLHIYNGVTNGINPSVATVLHQFFHAIAVTAYSKRSNQRRLKLYHYTI